MPTISVKTNILTIFLILVGAVSFSLLFSQYYFNQKLAMNSTHTSFSRISKNISEHLRKEASATHNILKATSKYKNILQPIHFDAIHPSLEGLIHVLEIKDNLHAIYFAQDNGSFYEVVNMNNRDNLYTFMQAPTKTRWSVITIINNYQQYTFLDKDLAIISSRKFAKKYDPRTRPWYIKAIHSNKIITTEPYLFSNINETGITYAKALKTKDAVIAVDYTMQQLNHILELQKLNTKSEVFLIDRNGKKYASSKYAHKKKSTISTNTIKNHSIKFTKKERDYIKNHPALIVSNEDDWAPFDFSVSGEPRGYSIDMLKLIAKKSGLSFKFSNGYQWADIMKMFQTNNIDIVHSLYKTDAREKMGNFTKALYSFKNYFIVRKEDTSINSPTQLTHKKVVVIKGWVSESYMREHYPKLSLVVVDNVADAFLALSSKQADVMIDTKESFAYLSKQLHIKNLKVSGWFSQFDQKKAKSIYMMVQKNEPILQSILNKTLDSITPKELDTLHTKWFNNANESTETKMISPSLMKALQSKKIGEIIEYSKDKEHYFAMLQRLATKNTYLGISIDADMLLKPYRDNLSYSLYIALLLLFLALPIIIMSANMIVEPIAALILENEKIKLRKFTDVKHINTNIIEFRDLSHSFVSMSESIDAYQKSQEEMLDSIIKLIAEAIDAKSPYTGGHCERVPEIAQMLLDEANTSTESVFKEFSLTSKDGLREFEIGAWLHDCGKVTTPEYVVDKSTKLETIYNRIHEIRMRFEVLWRDAQLEYMHELLENTEKELALEALHVKQAKLLDDYNFIAEVNIGGEFMDKAKQERVKAIASIEWQRHFNDRIGLGEVEKLRYEDAPIQELPCSEKLLDDKSFHIVKRENFDYEAYEKEGFKEDVPEYLYNYGEVYNLCIAKGTLSAEERYKINEHVIMSIKMLEKIPFPSQLKNIPEYAGTHHETLIGTGYPRKLTKDELSIPARIMAIADVFEALTASDRPYKQAKTLSASIKIMSFMVKDKHIDEDLFRLFLSSGVYKEYATKYLKEEQIDTVDIEKYL